MKIPTLYSTIVAGLLVCLVVGCTTRSAVDQVLTPTHRDFGGLFVEENITRLDNAVLLGSIWNLVVNPKGELLVLDTHSQGVHLFSPDGKLVWTMAITDCNPEANFSFGAQASFLDDSRVAVLIEQGGDHSRTVWGVRPDHH